MQPRHTLALLPLALGLASQAFHLPSSDVSAPDSTVAAPSNKNIAKPAPKPTKGTPKEFTIPVANLRDWAKTVVVSLDKVTVEGNSRVHGLEDDCEIHFGAHATEAFDGDPNGLVLEPMNACVEDPPSGFTSWPAFAQSLQKSPITAIGVPRIWPEHLDGGGASNPDHAVELHPLTGVVVGGKTFDLSGNVSAGDYHGKDGNRDIVTRVSVTVTTTAGVATVSFLGGQIGNFTTLDLLINRSSIASDGAGSFRMTGSVSLNGKEFPVHIVTAKGSPINASMPKIKKRSGPTQAMDGALVLHSLSPQALLDAATQSKGKEVEVDMPVQLILYGIPDSE